MPRGQPRPGPCAPLNSIPDSAFNPSRSPPSLPPRSAQAAMKTNPPRICLRRPAKIEAMRWLSRPLNQQPSRLPRPHRPQAPLPPLPQIRRPVNCAANSSNARRPKANFKPPPRPMPICPRPPSPLASVNGYGSTYGPLGANPARKRCPASSNGKKS